MAEIRAINLRGAKIIGEGSFGIVYKKKIQARFMAIKCIELQNEREKREAEARKEFKLLYEAKNHEHIVTVERLQFEEDRFLIIMEFMEGGTLLELINDNNIHLNDQQNLGFIEQILSAVQYIHARGIVHRDINPRNIFLDQSKSIAKLGDFGLGKEVRIEQSRTDPSGLHGTMRYTAPEVLRGEEYGRNVDVWSVGATFVHMLNGKAPYDQCSEQRIIYNVGGGDLTCELKRDVTRTIKDFVFTLLTFDKDRRPSSERALQLCHQLTVRINSGQAVVVDGASGYDAMAELQIQNDCNKCRYCGKEFKLKQQLVFHLRTHTTERPYECVECGECFSIASNLHSHERVVHDPTKPYKCPVCKQTFSRMQNCEMHQKTHVKN